MYYSNAPEVLENLVDPRMRELRDACSSAARFCLHELVAYYGEATTLYSIASECDRVLGCAEYFPCGPFIATMDGPESKDSTIAREAWREEMRVMPDNELHAAYMLAVGHPDDLDDIAIYPEAGGDCLIRLCDWAGGVDTVVACLAHVMCASHATKWIRDANGDPVRI